MISLNWSSVSRMVKLGLQAHQFGVHAQDLGADRMERAEPRHALMRAGEHAHPLAHLARRLVGEGDRQDLVRPRAAGGDQMGDAGGQHAGLADAGAGEHQHRPVERLDGCALFRVQPLEIGRDPAVPGAGDARRRFERRKGFRLGIVGRLRHGTNQVAGNVRGATGFVEPLKA